MIHFGSFCTFAVVSIMVESDFSCCNLSSNLMESFISYQSGITAIMLLSWKFKKIVNAKLFAISQTKCLKSSVSQRLN